MQKNIFLKFSKLNLSFAIYNVSQLWNFYTVLNLTTCSRFWNLTLSSCGLVE